MTEDMLRANAAPTSLTLNATAAFEIVEAKAGETPKRPTFSISAYNGGLMRVGGFYNPVVIDLAGLRAGATTPILLDHDASQIVGQGKATITAKAVTIEGTVTGAYDSAGDPAAKVVQHAKGGFVWAASVGVGIDQLESIAKDTKATVNGNEIVGPALIVRKGRLAETSFVAVGADESASAKVAATAAGDTKMNPFDQWVQAKGFDPATLTETQKTTLRASYDREVAGATPPAAQAAVIDRDLDAVVAAERDKSKRKAKITELTAKFLRERPDKIDLIEALARQAIAADKAPDTFELDMMRDLRMTAREIAPTSHCGMSSGIEANSEVIEAALCLAINLPTIDKHFSDATLSAARKRWSRGLSLGEFLITAARANAPGENFTSRDVRPLLKAAFAGGDKRGRNAMSLSAGFSTVDIDGILSNVANKMLRPAFDGVEQAWSPIAARVPVSDFKAVTIYSLTGDMQYEKVGAGGEIKHGTLGESSTTMQADTYGKMMAITRQDIINDDLGAFNRVVSRLGRGAALKINDVFWTEFMADASTFWTTGRGNYASGTTTVFGVDGLKKATTLFNKLTDPDGKPMASIPRILIVPVDLEVDAMIVTKSMDTRVLQDSTSTGAAATRVGTANPFLGKFNVVSSRYLSNTSYTGYSTTAFFLIADPNDVPVIAIGFLNGQEMPTIESADADFDKLGIQMRGFHDFGVKKQMYQGGVKLAGA